jgi:hypothetical protein
MIGTGAAISGPGIDPSVIEGAAGDIETEGDIYLGAAVQPVTVSLGINLSRWIPRTRADVEGRIRQHRQRNARRTRSAFNALSVGVGANYQILPVAAAAGLASSAGAGFLSRAGSCSSATR